MVDTWLGAAVGLALVPVVAIGTLLRGSRVFHPGGAAWTGTAESAEASTPTAARLSGKVLARFAGGRHVGITDAQPDIIGCSVRWPNPSGEPQDLIFGSFRWLTTLGRDLATTNTRDLLANTYFTASWHRDPDLGRVTWRLTPEQATGQGSNAIERLDDVVAKGGARFVLAYSPDAEMFTDVLTLTLTARATAEEHDDARSSFSPFNTGRGLVPVGFVNGIRSVVYPVGRALRGAP